MISRSEIIRGVGDQQITLTTPDIVELTVEINRAREFT